MYESHDRAAVMREFRKLQDRVPSLGEGKPPDPETASRILEAILGSGGIVPSRIAEKPQESTLTHALLHREGSCAAIVAVLLALAESRAPGFEAVILREHVVVGLKGHPDLFFETLGSGTMTLLELRQRHPFPPGGVIRLAPGEFLPYYIDNLAARLGDEGRTREADAMFRKALEMNGESGRIHFNYGTFLLENGIHDRALHQLELSIEYGWDNADAWVNQGVSLARLDRLPEAGRCFEKALEIDPSNRRARANLRLLNDK